MPPRSKKIATPTSKLAQALTFLCLAQRSNGHEISTHCLISDQYAAAFDTVIAAGCSIEEDLQCCPQTELFLAAIARCTDNFVLTQIGDSKLLVRSGEFQAYIPCLRPDTISWPVPNAMVTHCDNRLIDAMLKVAPLVATKADTVLECSVQLNAGSVVATNRAVIMEAWHGIDLPSGLLIPKLAIKALHAAKKNLMGFGFSSNTATFYFEDQSWIRTQLFQAHWPPVAEYLVVSDMRPIPPHLFDAAKRVAPFSANGAVYISQGFISSHPFTVKEEGSVLRLPIGSSDHEDRVYSINSLKLVSKHAEKWDENARPDGTMFTGDNVRGLIAHQLFSEQDEPLPYEGIQDDDIPF